jgi:hypothetical protein
MPSFEQGILIKNNPPLTSLRFYFGFNDLPPSLSALELHFLTQWCFWGGALPEVMAFTFFLLGKHRRPDS